MPTPLLKITDGTTSVTLLGLGSGWLLKDWAPAYPQPKDGGVRISSPMATGSEIVYRNYDNVIESFTLSVRQGCQNDIIAECRALDVLLLKAMDYWTSDWTSEPVWIEARGPEETNSRYAVIKNYAIAQLANPYAQPFFTAFGQGAINEVTLGLEHEIWQSDEPGTATCVQITASGEYTDVGPDLVDAPEASADDADVVVSTTTIALAGVALTFGRNATPSALHAGIRFTSVAIPMGAKVWYAYIEGQCDTNAAGATCNLVLYGEDVDDAATFANDYAAFMALTRTTAHVHWAAVPAWTAGTLYQTPDISTIVQEIVDRAAWVSGNDMVIFVQDDTSSASANRNWASFDHGAGVNPPQLHIVYSTQSTTTATYGVSTGTCTETPRVVNHHGSAGLTHIFRYDASAATYSTNLLGTALPYNLWPTTPPENNDCLYVGTALGIANCGPFDNIALYLSAALTYTDPGVGTWEYWNGAWVSLSAYDESWGHSIAWVTVTGAYSVSWGLPADWTTTLVNGVNGWWVRLRMDLSGGGAAVAGNATQASIQPYSCTWAYENVDDAQTGGDITMLARHMLRQVSDEGYSTYTSPNGDIGKFAVGLRSLSRGQDFSAYIPLGRASPMTGIDVAMLTANSTQAADPYSIYRYATLYSVAAASAMASEFRIGIYTTSNMSSQYTGAYHAFLRYRVTTGAADDDLGVRVSVSGAYGQEMYSSEVKLKVYPTHVCVADLGRLSLGAHTIGMNPAYTDTIYIKVQVANYVAAARSCYFYDIVLIPVDEWYAGCGLSAEASSGPLLSLAILDMDSVYHPKKRRLCAVRRKTTLDVLFSWVLNSVGDNILQSGKDQRLWFFMRNYHAYWPTTTPLLASFHLGMAPQLEGTKRYLNMRGAS